MNNTLLMHVAHSVNILLITWENTVIQILRAASDGCRSRPCLAYSRINGPSDCRCFQTLTVLFQFIFLVDGHVHRRTFAKRKH